MRLRVNGRVIEVEAEPDMPLLWALRDLAGITGPKFGCGIAACGACTVHLDGAPLRSCVTPVSAVGDKKIEVIKEVLGIGESLSGNLLMYDALNTSFHKVRVKPDPECPLCGSHPSITDLSAHEATV